MFENINDLSQSGASADTPLITVTSSAVEEVRRLMSQEKDENLFLRLGVSSGGCSGMSYSMALDSNRGENDVVYEFEGLEVRVDAKSLLYIQGSTLDYTGGMLGGGFKFENPNAKRSCGCGSSFTC